jgi:predicted nucleic acid-binding Zn ribbon protein
MTPVKKDISPAISEIKACLECGDPIKGRADKKFCSDQCRVTYNNRLNSDDTNYLRNVNYALRKNRRILVELNTTGKTKVSREKLMRKGFDFGYFTSTYKTKDGAIYYYCYEQGYLPIEKEYYLLVVKQE